MLPKFQSESLSSYQQLFAILENEKGSHIDIDHNPFLLRVQYQQKLNSNILKF